MLLDDVVREPLAAGSVERPILLSAKEGLRVLDGVAGTDNVGRPFPMLNGGFVCGRDGGGMDEKAASSRAVLTPLAAGFCAASADVVADGEVARELSPVGGAEGWSDRFCCGGDMAAAFGFLMSSAARRTLVGTRFKRIAPLLDEGVVAEVSLAAGLKADDESEPDVHGDGKGLSGEIMDAEDERVGIVFEFLPPTSGILRVSSDDGLRNSDGRRCLGGLWWRQHSHLLPGGPAAPLIAPRRPVLMNCLPRDRHARH